MSRCDQIIGIATPQMIATMKNYFASKGARYINNGEPTGWQEILWSLLSKFSTDCVFQFIKSTGRFRFHMHD